MSPNEPEKQSEPEKKERSLLDIPLHDWPGDGMPPPGPEPWDFPESDKDEDDHAD